MTAPASDVIARARTVVQAEQASLADLSIGYPANHFAWRTVLADSARRGHTMLHEVGVGGGNGVAHVLAAGMAFTGVDHDAAKVDVTRGVLTALGSDPDAVACADVMDAQAMRRAPGFGQADAVMALGIAPHAADDTAVLRAIASIARPGGRIHVEYRNALFALVTFNRLTHELIVDDLLGDMPESLRAAVGDFIEPRVLMDRPPLPTSGHAARFHNPLTIPRVAESVGLIDVSVRPFHFHAGMPAVESQDPAAFRTASLALEDDESGWRGLFLASAVLLSATVPELP